MTTVYVLTAGRGDSYRIERVYLDREEAYGFAQDYNGITPIESVQVEEWQVGAPPSVYDGPYWRAEWWARLSAAKRRSALRHTDEGERFDDFAIRQEWWTGEALPEAKVVRRELAGAPRSRWWACPRRRSRRSSGRRSPRSGPTWQAYRGNEVRCFAQQVERKGHGGSTLPPSCVMMPVWIDAPWTGSATTS